MTNFGKSILIAAILESVALASGAQEVTTPGEPQVATIAGLTESDFKTVANGSFDLSLGSNSPIYAEFEDSPELTARLRAVLSERGFALADGKESAKSILTFRGEVVLLGGPVFYRGLKISVAEATDKAFKAEEKDRPTYRSDVIRGVAGFGVNAAGYSRGMSNFMPGAPPWGDGRCDHRVHRSEGMVQFQSCGRSSWYLPEQMRRLEEGQPDGVHVGESGNGRREERSSESCRRRSRRPLRRKK